MRRLAILVLCFFLVSCTADAPEPPDRVASAAPSTAEPRATPDPVETLEPNSGCRGLGKTPGPGEITLVEKEELLGFSPGGRRRCLLDLGRLGLAPSIGTAPSWNAAGDRLIVRHRAISRDGSVSQLLTRRFSEYAIWSRPTGTSVMYLTRNGQLMKRTSFGGETTDISFLSRHDAVTYHPAGTHIATTGVRPNGDYGLFLATNVGTDPKLLARGEAARFITNLHFTEDGDWLYYTARHGPRDWHLHRLGIGPGLSGILETLAKGDFDFEYAVSPFDSGFYAWFQPGDCAAGEPGRFKVQPSKELSSVPDSEEHNNVHPVGWLPDGQLVVRTSTTGCSTAQPGNVYVLSRSDVMLIDEENYGNVSVRVVHPPPPPPPGGEQEVVA
jgi:hypothetical protein